MIAKYSLEQVNETEALELAKYINYKDILKKAYKKSDDEFEKHQIFKDIGNLQGYFALEKIAKFDDKKFDGFDLDEVKKIRNAINTKSKPKTDFETIRIEFEDKSEAKRIFDNVRNNLSTTSLYYKISIEDKTISYTYNRLHTNQNGDLSRSKINTTSFNGEFLGSKNSNANSIMFLQDLAKTDKKLLFAENRGHSNVIFSSNEILNKEDAEIAKLKEEAENRYNITKKDIKKETLEKRGSHKVSNNLKSEDTEKIDSRLSSDELFEQELDKRKELYRQAKEQKDYYTEMFNDYLKNGDTLEVATDKLNKKSKNEYVSKIVLQSITEQQNILQKEVDKQKEIIVEKENQLEKTKEGLEKSSKIIESLSSEKKEQQTKLQEYSNALQDASNELDKLDTENLELTDKKLQLEKDNKKLEEQNSDLVSEAETLSKENADLQDVLDSKEKTLEKNKTEMNALQEQINKLQEDLQNKDKVLEFTKKSLEESAKQNYEYEAQNSKLQEDLENKNKTLEFTKKSLEENVEKVYEYEGQIQELSKNNKNIESHYREEISNLEKDLQSKDTENSKLQKDLESKNTENSKLENSVKELNNLLKDKKRNIEELQEKYDSQIKIVNTLKIGHNKQIEKLENKLEKLEHKIGTLEETNHTLSIHNTKLSQLVIDYSNKETQTHKKEQKLDRNSVLAQCYSEFQEKGEMSEKSINNLKSVMTKEEKDKLLNFSGDLYDEKHSLKEMNADKIEITEETTQDNTQDNTQEATQTKRQKQK